MITEWFGEAFDEWQPFSNETEIIHYKPTYTQSAGKNSQLIKD